MEQRRTIVAAVAPTAGSERRACRWLGFHRSAVRRRPADRGDAALRRRLRALAEDHPRWGAPMLTWKLRQEGVGDNHKRIRRLYRAEGLAVRRRARKRAAGERAAAPAAPAAAAPNEHWAADFMRDTLADGRAFRTLNVLDVHTRRSASRECLRVDVDVSLTGPRVVAAFEALGAARGWPQRISVDSGPEFRGKCVDAWAHGRGVRLQFSRAGRPVDNTFIEAFNGRMRDECLTQHWFLSLADARRTIEAWRVSYNTARPHRALAGRTPAAYAAELAATHPTHLSGYERT